MLDIIIVFQGIFCSGVAVKFVSFTLEQILKEKGVSGSFQTIIILIQSPLLIGLSYFNMKQLSYFTRIMLVVTMVIWSYLLVYSSIKLYYNSEHKIDKNTVVFTGNLFEHIDHYNKPIWPGYILMCVQGSGLYEGVPLIPKLFVNARN